MLFDNGVGNVRIMPGALLLPLGFGLLNRREFCRRAAVWCVVAGFVFNLIMLGWLFGKAFGLFVGLDVVARILGQPMNSAVGAMLTFLIFAGQVLLLPWMFLMLMRADVRSAFTHVQNKPRPLVEWGMTVLVLLVMFGQVRVPLENRLKTGVYFTNLRISENRIASVGVWSPTLAPGEKLDLEKFRQETANLIGRQKYKEALQRCVWYHHYAVQIDPAQSAVRLSFAMEQWSELARSYPPARQAMIETRDRAAAEFAKGGGSFALFQEVSAFNERLQQSQATMELFASIQRQDPEMGRQCYFAVERALVEKGDYAVCEKFIPDFQQRYKFSRDVYRRTGEIADRSPGVNVTIIRRDAHRRFVNDTRMLIEILVGVGRKAEAEKIQEQALAVLNVPQLQSAVSDAEEKIQSKLVGSEKK